MSHDTEPEEVKLVSIVEREAEEAYPVQHRFVKGSPASKAGGELT